MSSRAHPTLTMRGLCCSMRDSTGPERESLWEGRHHESIRKTQPSFLTRPTNGSGSVSPTVPRCSWKKALWTEANFGELKTYFLERPDTGTGTFEAKLRIQLEPVSPETRRLWAEMTWLYYLIVVNVTRITKLDRIRTVWEWSGEVLPEDHWALGDVLEGGIVNPGMGYFGHQWREFNFIITLMVDWWARSPAQRQSFLAHPWKFAEWLDGLPGGRQRLFRHALLFLLFPDEFEPIMSIRHKRDIVGASAEQTGRTLDVDRLNPVALDKSLLEVVKRLHEAKGVRSGRRRNTLLQGASGRDLARQFVVANRRQRQVGIRRRGVVPRAFRQSRCLGYSTWGRRSPLARIP